MAKAVNNKTNSEVENSEIMEKFNINEFLSRDFTRDEFLHQVLNGQISEQPHTWNNVNKNIEEFLGSTLDNYKKELKNNVNTMISEEIVSLIKKFDDIQRKRLELEEELRKAERERFQIEKSDDITTQMKKMEMDIEINEMKRTLDSTNKAYIEAYKNGLEKTQISHDFDSLALEVRSIESQLFDQIEVERDVLKAQLKVLDLLSHKVEIMDYLKKQINSRLDVRGDYADRVIKSSKMKIPVIQAIVK